MKCPFCAEEETQVLESRVVNEGHAIRRRRECIACSKRFTTYETVRGSVLWVTKKNGRREPFDKEKVRRGLLRAIEKRPISLTTVDNLVDQIEREMLRKEKEEVTSEMIGKAVLKRLKRIDKVAWLRFASVYLQFEDLDDFSKAIQK
ncbi:transcriptional repressor NrdR [Candidatus Woesebacteria bacterium]|nr:MAG: transcriptional repressor NrdR [Candidatus Woesebacteria bacterium]